ncbi:MAG: hypothetical protein GY719_09060 [bacterium]|nr:hypothetical protein [bacterium]
MSSTCVALIGFGRIGRNPFNTLCRRDILRDSHSGTFDSLATMTQEGSVSKTLTWFDNGWGYSHRAADLINRFIELDREVA